MPPLPNPLTPPQPTPAQLAIFDAELPSHVLSRRMVETSDGRRYQLFIAVPKTPAPEGGYPVIYMLDGNAAFDALTPELLAAAPHLVLIGIGYDTPLRFDRAARSLDYTPADAGVEPYPDPKNPDRMIGGAAGFLTRLHRDLVQQAEAGLQIAPGRRTIWGHSLAGISVLFGLLTAPGVFLRYVAVSPALWWGDEFLLRLEDAVARDAVQPADIIVMLGDSERRSSPEGPHWDGPAPHTMEMVRRLGLRSGLTVSSHIFAGAGHAMTLPASLETALEFASR